MAQWVKYSLCKQKELSSDSWRLRKASVVAYADNLGGEGRRQTQVPVLTAKPIQVKQQSPTPLAESTVSETSSGEEAKEDTECLIRMRACIYTEKREKTERLKNNRCVLVFHL